MNMIEITPVQLTLCMSFVLLAAAGSLVFRLRLEKDLLWGSVRTFAQLFLVGYVLKFVFRLNNPYVIVSLYLWMIFWAAHTIRGRVQEKRVSLFGPTFVSMAVSYMVVVIFVTGAIVRVKPWYTPQYFIPLGGMIIGNSMNAIAIALERMFSDLRKQREQVELAFCLGATYQEATDAVIRSSIRAGMIPSINALMTVGLVSLPGMMTGQILAGADPMSAVKYQIIVMLMLVASTAVGSMLVVHIVRRLCFTASHQMIL